MAHTDADIIDTSTAASDIFSGVDALSIGSFGTTDSSDGEHEVVDLQVKSETSAEVEDEVEVEDSVEDMYGTARPSVILQRYGARQGRGKEGDHVPAPPPPPPPPTMRRSAVHVTRAWTPPPDLPAGGGIHYPRTVTKGAHADGGFTYVDNDAQLTFVCRNCGAAGDTTGSAAMRVWFHKKWRACLKGVLQLECPECHSEDRVRYLLRNAGHLAERARAFHIEHCEQRTDISVTVLAEDMDLAFARHKAYVAAHSRPWL